MKPSSARLLGVSGLFVLAFLALSTAPLSGQTTGSIRGEVETGGTPLPGVTVEARSPNLQGARLSVTDENGRFNLTLLPPGSYTITATLDGFAPRSQTLQLGLNQAATTRFELIASATAEVTVTAQSVDVETQSNTIGRNVDDKVFQALPTGRNYASVAQLTSGVNTDNSDVRQTSITVYGATGLENAYLVDGANTTGIEIGSQGKVLNFEFIQEVELKAGGYEAEYTGAQGGILNVVTKSGGNEFHGDVFGYFDNDSLQAENKHLDEITAEGIPVGFTRSDYGADIGRLLPQGRSVVLRRLRPRQEHAAAAGDDGPVRRNDHRPRHLQQPLLRQADLDAEPVEHLHRHRLRRPDRGQRRGDPGDRAAVDLPRHGHGGRNGFRRPVPGHAVVEVPSDRPVRVPPGGRRHDPGPGRQPDPFSRQHGRRRHGLRRLHRGGGQRSIRDEDVHALRLPDGRQLLLGQPRHQGRSRLPAHRRRRVSRHRRRPAGIDPLSLRGRSAPAAGVRPPVLRQRRLDDRQCATWRP